MTKNKKLALQVSAIVTLMFILTIAFIGYLVVSISKKMYIESNNKRIANEVEEYKDLYINPEIVGWVLDEWESDPGMMLEPETDEEITIRDDMWYIRDMARLCDKSTVENMTPELRKTFLKALYSVVIRYFDEKRKEGDFEAVYCLDIRPDDDLYEIEKDDIFVIFDCSDEADESGSHGLGEFMRNEEQYTLIDTLQNGTYGVDFEDVVCQELKADEYNMLLYLAAVPVFVDDEMRYVLCFEYDWSIFAHILNVNLNYMIIWGIIGMINTNALLVFFIYFRAVRPTVQVNNGVCEYIKTKDSAVVIQKMAAIKAKNEIGRLAGSISELAAEIDRYNEENLRLHGERERVAAELDLAAKIQDDMLPKKFPELPELVLSASMDPAKEVGGDFYDFFFIDETHLGLVIADVSGKGVPAALFMMMSLILIKNYAMSGLSPAEVMNSTNMTICDNNKNNMFVTVWFGVLDITTGHITASNAGHEYPMIKKNSGEFEIMNDEHGLFIGAFRTVKYTQYEFDLEPGGTLFVYTDGAAEATDKDNMLFGTERMLGALNSEPSGDPEKLIGNMKKAIDIFVGEAPQFDDLTMLCIKYHGKQ